MSELYTVAVEKVVGPRVELRVTTVHPDAGPPPTAATFPMNLLVDLWDHYDRKLHGLVDGVPRLSDDEAVALAAREPWGPVFRELRKRAHGEQVPVTREEQQRIRQEGTYRGRRLSSWGSHNDEYFVTVSYSQEEFAEIALPLVAAYEQDQLEHQDAYDAWPEWESDGYFDRIPRARLIVTMKDAALLGFVKPGARFDTASWF